MDTTSRPSTLPRPPDAGSPPASGALCLLRPGRERLGHVVARAQRDALTLIAEHCRGKKRRSVERTFLAIHDLCLDAFAKRGATRAPAERRWLADQAGVHVETLDAAVLVLEDLGLVARTRRRVHYSRNMPNLWSLTGAAELPRLSAEVKKPDTGTHTSATPLNEGSSLKKSARRACARAASSDAGYDFRWPDGAAEHPVLHGLDRETRFEIAEVYEIVRERLLDAGIERVPEGGWLAAIRDCRLVRDGLNLDLIEDALRDFLLWREEGGPLCYSFAWMHRHRRSPCPPPSMLFGLEDGDERDRSYGENALSFWINGQRW